MFDLNESVDRWRQQMRRGGRCGQDDIAELEDHLREEMTSLEKLGLSGEEAFLLAARRLGRTDMLTEEFEKINVRAVWLSRLRWMALGVLGYFLWAELSFAMYQAIATLSAYAGLSGYRPAAVGLTLTVAFSVSTAILLYRAASRFGLSRHTRRWIQTRRARIGLYSAAVAVSVALPAGCALLRALCLRVVSRSDYARVIIASSVVSTALSVLVPLALAIWIVRFSFRQWQVGSA